MTGRMRTLAAAVLAMAALMPAAHAETAGSCRIEAGAGRLALQPSEIFDRVAGLERRSPAMSHRVLSLVARNIGQFDVEMDFDGPFAGATEQRQIELMTSIADELGLRAGAGKGTPASDR